MSPSEAKRRAREAAEEWAHFRQRIIDTLGPNEGLLDCPRCDRAVVLSGDEDSLRQAMWRCPCTPSTMQFVVLKSRRNRRAELMKGA